jgi:hypothetical protein
MGHMKIWYDGKSYSVDENETIGTLKTKVLNLPPEMMLMDEKCKLLNDKKSAREAGLANGQAVMPVVRPRYGA